MALWKESTKSQPSTLPDPPDVARFDVTDLADSAVPAKPSTPLPSARSTAESHISPDLTIEGKIEGAGHVRIAGSFKGEINVQGDVTIESGAKVTASVRAERITVAGDLVGNVENAQHVELLQTGSISGDVKARTFCVAKGSRMRGNAEFGWDETSTGVTSIRKNSDTAGGQAK